MKSAPHTLSAEFSVGGQEHFYLEGQIAFALPGEDGDIVVHSSTQHPTEVQHICARLLGCDFNQVTTVVRRLGGGFGGKESNASWVAGAAALAANHTGKPVKLRLPRETDMIATGKRHPFLYRYTVGFDGEGRVLALDAMLAADAGWSLDLTPGVMARALTLVSRGPLESGNPHECFGLARLYERAGERDNAEGALLRSIERPGEPASGQFADSRSGQRTVEQEIHIRSMSLHGNDEHDADPTPYLVDDRTDGKSTRLVHEH